MNTKSTHNSSERFPEYAVEIVAARLAAIADPTRIRLLELLNVCDATVSEISERLDIAPAEVSQHLAALHAGGFVSRWGSPATYHLIDWTDWWVIEQVARNLTDPHRADRGDVK